MTFEKSVLLAPGTLVTVHAARKRKKETQNIFTTQKIIFIKQTHLYYMWDICYGPSDLAPSQIGNERFYMIHSRHGLLLAIAKVHGLVSSGFILIIHPEIDVATRHPHTTQSPRVS